MGGAEGCDACLSWPARLCGRKYGHPCLRYGVKQRRGSPGQPDRDEFSVQFQFTGPWAYLAFLRSLRRDLMHRRPFARASDDVH
jgi:hypothetical protein